jgi:hypothetical protein
MDAIYDCLMSIDLAEFDASASMLGYLFQVRMALVLLLRRVKSDPGASVSLENFDDIAFHTAGNVVEQLQTKLVASKSLSDSSVDLWKTLRVWSEQFRQGILDPSSTALTLLTTAEAPIASAASYLGLQNRNHSKALSILEKITTQSKNASNLKAYEAFMRLPTTRRSQLIRAIYVLDRSPGMSEAQQLLRQELRFSTLPKFVPQLSARIEGWWFEAVVLQLSAKNSLISGAALEEELADLREQFRLDNLPIDFAEAELPDEVSYEDYPFVRQLNYIELAPRRISSAKLDFYRAVRQRGRWIDDQVIGAAELTSFERRLVENWLEIFEGGKQECDGSNKAKTGRAIYDRTLQTPLLLIRPGCTEQYVMRGSYHSLANLSRLGWHPEFDTLAKGESNDGK